jgi:two-component system, chemotaxis family, sensor kinase CheA
LVIPLTLAFFEGLVVRTNNCLYAIPIESVSEVLQTETKDISISSASQQMFILRQGSPIPLFNLDQSEGSSNLGNIIVVIQSTHGNLGLIMDEIIGQQQVIMKPLTGHLRDIRGGAGCALLSSGEVAIALDVEQLFLDDQRMVEK